MTDHTAIPWHHDYEAAQVEAARVKRPVLLDFSAAPM
jgi:hypothetical protein